MDYHLYLSKKRTNAQKLTPIYIKITIDNNIYERSTGVFIDIDQWNKIYKRVKPSYTGAEQLNKKLNDVETKLQDLKSNNANISEVDNKLKEKKTKPKQPVIKIETVINDYLTRQSELIGLKAGITKSTYRGYKAKVDNLREFLKNIKRVNALITELDYKFADLYRTWLYCKEFSTGHVNKCVKFVKTLVRFAQFEYSIKATNIFLLTLKEDAPKPIVYLTGTELKAIQKRVYHNPLHQKTVDLFLLQCFTGMGYSDVIKLNVEKFISFDGRWFIGYQRVKTSVKALIPVLPKVISILNCYGGKAPVLSNEVYNRVLKEIAALNNINKRLTSHVGRKTFACMLVSRGASMETTTKMLAKTNVRETERIYAEVQFERVLKEFPKIG
ncbi:MAG: site-specific integrase [Bacteroidota bacterium]